MRSECPNCKDEISKDLIYKMRGKNKAQACNSCGRKIYVSPIWSFFVEFSEQLSLLSSFILFFLLGAYLNIWFSALIAISFFLISLYTATFIFKFAKIKLIPE